MDKVLFHTFTTDGYIPWAELYLESLRYHYGDKVNVRIDSLNLNDAQVDLLKKIHSRLDLRNVCKDYGEAAREIDVSPDRFQRWQTELESGKINKDNYLFKIFISVNQRYRSMDEVIAEAIDSGFTYLIHSDVDAYFRRRLDCLFNILETNDLAAFFRNRSKSQEKILGAFLAFNLKGNIREFVTEWMKQIDAVPFRSRWRGFGQSALWYAAQNTKGSVRVADLSAYNGIYYSQMFEKKAHFWLGSNSISSRNDVPLKRGWSDFKKGFPRIGFANNPKKTKDIFLDKVCLFGDTAYMLARKLKRKLRVRD